MASNSNAYTDQHTAEAAAAAASAASAAHAAHSRTVLPSGGLEGGDTVVTTTAKTKTKTKTTITTTITTRRTAASASLRTPEAGPGAGLPPGRARAAPAAAEVIDVDAWDAARRARERSDAAAPSADAAQRTPTGMELIHVDASSPYWVSSAHRNGRFDVAQYIREAWEGLRQVRNHQLWQLPPDADVTGGYYSCSESTDSEGDPESN